VRCTALAVCLLALPGRLAAQDMCALLLEVETDAANAAEGRPPPPERRADRIAEIGALAAENRDLARQLLALSLAYRAAEMAPEPGDFSLVLRRAAGELRWLLPVCDVTAPGRPAGGLVLKPRPPATAARAPDPQAEEPAPLLPGIGAISRPGGRDKAPPPVRAALHGLAVLAAVAAGLALWMQWYFVARPSGAKRYPCSVPVRVGLRGAADETRLEDISRHGARLRLRAVPLGIGDMVEVSCPHFTRTGRVQWANDHYAGLRFRAPLPKAAIEACLEVSGAAPQAREPP